ncbi:hypothetical protein ACQY0O_006647 [Thecaphora frezii]
MTRGNQRELARAKNQKKQAELNKGKTKQSNTSLAKKKEADAEALRLKAAVSCALPLFHVGRVVAHDESLQWWCWGATLMCLELSSWFFSTVRPRRPRRPRRLGQRASDPSLTVLHRSHPEHQVDDAAPPPFFSSPGRYRRYSQLHRYPCRTECTSQYSFFSQQP